MKDIKVRALGEKVTIYNNEGQIIKEIPPPPSKPPKVTYVNIIEIENRIMGIDSNVKPDFFIDFDNDERFRDLRDDPELSGPVKCFDMYAVIDLVYMLLFGIASVIFGYTVI